MTSDLRTAFSGVDVAVMLAKLDRRASDDQHEHLKTAVRISRQHGAAIDKFAKETVKVIFRHAYTVSFQAQNSPFCTYPS